MMAQYKDVNLFGGAMTASLPSTFGDVSDIRQIPDNQEVYLSTDGYTSIVFDVLERVDMPDLEALEYHFSDIADEDMEKTKFWSTGEAHFTKLPQGTKAYTMFATTPAVNKESGRPNEADFFGVLMTVVRLEEKKTDVVLMVYVPHVSGEYDPVEIDPEKGKNGPLIDVAFQYRQKLLETFEIKDWDLFVEG